MESGLANTILASSKTVIPALDISTTTVAVPKPETVNTNVFTYWVNIGDPTQKAYVSKALLNEMNRYSSRRQWICLGVYVCIRV